MQQNDLIQDFDALVQAKTLRTPSGLSRRDALRAALGAGLGMSYTLAAGSAVAQTAIQTPADGLTAGQVNINANGFTLPAYRAAPVGQSGLPVVLVVQEIFGVHAYIADVCRRFARAGYLAIAPELYARQGDPHRYSDIASLLSELVAKVPDAQVMQDLDATVAWAGANGGDTNKVAVTGFCWGGRITWLYAAHGTAHGTAHGSLKAAVAWYGRLVGQSSDLAPRHPVDIAAALNAPVLGLYGGRDTGIALDTVERMKAALAQGNAASRASDIIVYPDAPHGFHADYRASFRQDAAEDGWGRTLDWFKRHGVAR